LQSSGRKRKGFVMICGGDLKGKRRRKSEKWGEEEETSSERV
jgi:hypothetical protein